MKEEEKIELLTAFLNLFWLRPENAYASTLKSLVLKPYPFSKPIIDVGCGDGLFSFTTLGGRLDLGFDTFLDVANLEKVRNKNADMFDSYDKKTYIPKIIKPPSLKIEYGTDFKQNSLLKAANLDLYGKLVLHDNNEKMPFENNSLMTLYSNTPHYVNNMEFHLSELKRIIRPEGLVLLSVVTDKIKDYTLGHYAPFLGANLAKIIDRGRLDAWKNLKSFSWWQKKLKQLDFDIVAHKGFMGKVQSYVWDIGLRPLAPHLVKMANNLDKKQRREIKGEWIAHCIDLLMPLVNLEPSSDEECSEFLFVLKKRR